MTAHTRISGSWADVDAIYARVGGSWKTVDTGYAKIAGTWKQFWSAAVANMTATGGTIVDAGGYRYHTFTASGAFTVTADPTDVEYLVVAGGGGGGSNGGGGGGAGGLLAGTATPTITSYTVTIGAGGAGANGSSSSGTNGSNSVFGAFATSFGGGFGAGRDLGQVSAASGGSGGGGAGTVSGDETAAGGAGTSGQGNDGGDGTGYSLGASATGGGGGGAGAVGGNGAFQHAGDGGAGSDYSTWATATSTGDAGYYAGGGGGNDTIDGTGSLGGVGGGGDAPNRGQGAAGQVNTGGGGGGSGFQTPRPPGGAGGSGIVIIRYPYTVAAGTYELIETQVLSSNAASVTFTGLSAYAADYKHLQIRGAIRTSRVSNQDNLGMRLNGDSGNNYTVHWLNADGSSITTLGLANFNTMVLGEIACDSVANNFAPVVIDLLDAFSTTKNTTMRGTTSDSRKMTFNGGLWNNTAAVTSIEFFSQQAPSTATWVAGSRFSLYGIR